MPSISSAVMSSSTTFASKFGCLSTSESPMLCSHAPAWPVVGCPSTCEPIKNSQKLAP